MTHLLPPSRVSVTGFGCWHSAGRGRTANPRAGMAHLGPPRNHCYQCYRLYRQTPFPNGPTEYTHIYERPSVCLTCPGTVGVLRRKAGNTGNLTSAAFPTGVLSVFPRQH